MFFSEELRFALENDYTLLAISKAYAFKRGDNTFLDLIQKLNAMKVEAQHQKQPTIRNLSKLLMNSMYGMHTDDLKHAIIDTLNVSKLSKDYLIKEIIPFGNFILVSYTLYESNLDVGSNSNTKLKKAIKGLPGETNVAIAAAITSYSRMIINQFKLKPLDLGLNIYYSDTDSLILNGELPSEYCDPAQLGLLKLEYKFKEGIFVMPKVYYLELEDGEAITRCKGYPGRLTKDQYIALLNNQSLNLSITKWARSLRGGSVQILRNQPYYINPTFNKIKKEHCSGWAVSSCLIMIWIQ